MKAGIDVLLEERRDLLTGRIGLLSHQAATGKGGATSAQLLRRALGDRLVALFGPEHGYFGTKTAGEATSERVHPDWGIPIHSLYGALRKPSRQMLEGLDAVVFDLQDLGVRCYTYLATLHLFLQACAEANVKAIIADRAIPLPGLEDGPWLETAFTSFVAPLPLPMHYGMSPGQSARWMALNGHSRAEFTVVECAQSDGGEPEFIPPSPGIRTREAAFTYAATVFSEALPAVDCGRGTQLAFRVVAAPWIKGEELCEAANGRIPGLALNPHRYMAAGASYDGREMDGARLTITDVSLFRPVSASIHILDLLQKLGGKDRLWQSEGARPEWFDKLYGNAATRRQLMDETSPADIISGWRRR